MTAYYNEFNPYAAQWLRNLIDAGHIAPGLVDERSIEDVTPNDLTGFTQCHFFAGIGVWSYSLRLAGWPDNREVWTGSCPCQPFSSAGKSAGFDDERHLWPAWNYLIKQRKPSIILGEQVASKDGLTWLDLVQSNLEDSDYANASIDLCSAGIGAPHIRQRLWFVGERLGDPKRERFQGSIIEDIPGARRREEGGEFASSSCAPIGLADSCSKSSKRDTRSIPGEKKKVSGERAFNGDISDRHSNGGENSSMADTNSIGCDSGETATRQKERVNAWNESRSGFIESSATGPTNGFWGSADWLFCRDGKWRPVRPGPQQMVDGSAGILGSVCSKGVKKTEAEIDEWSKRYKTDPRKALRDLWSYLQKEALSERSSGRLWLLYEAPFLLSFMRQLSDQKWKFSDSMPRQSKEKYKNPLRSLFVSGESSCSPLRRELEKQRFGESSNPMRELSQIMARKAEEYWSESCWSYATKGFPLAVNSIQRVGRLSGYGNAINAQAAKIFIESVMDCKP
jgi:site-specific DNA-cytosine methylase